MQTIGERLKHIRESMKLTQKEFASIFNMSQGALSDAEKNKRGLSQETIISFFGYNDFRIDVEWLLTGITSNVNSKDTLHLNEDEKELVKDFRALDKHEKWIIRGRISEMVYNQNVEKSKVSAHDETPVNVGILDRVNK